jgi:hypothetical protein
MNNEAIYGRSLPSMVRHQDTGDLAAPMLDIVILDEPSPLRQVLSLTSKSFSFPGSQVSEGLKRGRSHTGSVRSAYEVQHDMTQCRVDFAIDCYATRRRVQTFFLPQVEYLRERYVRVAKLRRKSFARKAANSAPSLAASSRQSEPHHFKVPSNVIAYLSISIFSRVSLRNDQIWRLG